MSGRNFEIVCGLFGEDMGQLRADFGGGNPMPSIWEGNPMCLE